MAELALDAVDRRIINGLQGSFPVSDQPYAEAAEKLGLSEEELIERLKRLDESGTMSRFGPMYHAERLGGAVTLAALAAPPERYEDVVQIVNGHSEVAHNYARDHALNMWFVIAAEAPQRIAEVIEEIEAETGLEVLNLPKYEEFFIGLKVNV